MPARTTIVRKQRKNEKRKDQLARVPPQNLTMKASIIIRRSNRKEIQEQITRDRSARIPKFCWPVISGGRELSGGINEGRRDGRGKRQNRTLFAYKIKKSPPILLLFHLFKYQ